MGGASRTAHVSGIFGCSAWHVTHTSGDQRLRKGARVYDGRGGSLVDVLVRHVFVAEVDKRLGPKKPLSPTQLLARVKPGEGVGGRGERGPGLRMINRAEASRPLWRAPRSKLLAAKLRVAGRAEGDKEPITGSRGVSSTT